MERIKYLAIILPFSFILAGCSQLKLSLVGNVIGNSSSISGNIVISSNSVVLKVNSKNLNRAQSACEPKVEMVDLSSKELLANGTIGDNNQYKIKLPSALYQRVKSEEIGFEVRYTSCTGDVLLRPVTGSVAQDISLVSTLVSLAIESVDILGYSLPTEYSVKDSEKLISQLATISEQQTISSINDLYTLIVSSPQSSEVFNSAMGFPAKDLEKVPASVYGLEIPNVIDEKELSEFKLSTYHWLSTYQEVVKWEIRKIGSSTTYLDSADKQFTHFFNENSQGEYSVKLSIGSNDGGGNIDTNMPIKIFESPLTIKNTVLPSAPLLQLNSGGKSSITNLFDSSIRTTEINLSILTGADLINCESFDSLSFAVNNSTKPLGSSFNLLCSEPIQQDLVIPVESLPEGQHRVYLWAKDSSSTVSETPKTFVFNVDNTAPSIAVTSNLNKFHKQGEQLDISWLILDNDQVLGSSIKLSVSTDDGSSWTQITGPYLSTGSQQITLPSHDVTDFRIKIEASDVTGHRSEWVSPSYTIDSTPPSAPLLTRTSDLYSPTNQISVNVSGCSGDATHIFFSPSISTPTASANGWLDCGNSFNIETPNVQGMQSIYGYLKDRSGNVSLISNEVQHTRDSIAPVISFYEALNVKAQKNPQFSWNVTETNISSATNIEFLLSPDGITYQTISNSIPATDGPLVNNRFSYTPSEIPFSMIGSDGRSHARVRVSDFAGNTASANFVFTVDQHGPVISEFMVENSDQVQSKTYLKLRINAQDQEMKINRICTLDTLVAAPAPTSPAISNPCWTALPLALQAKNLSISYFDGVFHQLSSVAVEDYNIYLFLMDEAGNISTFQMGVSEKVSLSFNPGSTPSIKNIVASFTDTPNSPPLLSEINSGGTQNVVYIKWHLSDDEGLSPTPVELKYTTDRVDYTLISGGLPNSAGSGCSVDGLTQTGCYRWILPAELSGLDGLEKFFIVQIKASDSDGMTTLGESNTLNNGSMRLIAGDVNLGLNGSAKNYSYRIQYDLSSETPTKGSFVVADDGTVYFYDKSIKTVVKVDPSDGMVKEFFKTSSDTSGAEGALLSDVTFKAVWALQLDYNNGLLVWDNDRIRRIDLKTLEVRTIVGASGASTNPAEPIVGADQIKLDMITVSALMPVWTVLPNGQMFLRASGSMEDIYWKYLPPEAESQFGTMEKIVVSGPGWGDRANYIWGQDDSNNWNIRPFALNVSFNPITSEINEMFVALRRSLVGNHQMDYARLDYLNKHPGDTYFTRPPYNLNNRPYRALFFTGMDGKFYVLNNLSSSIDFYNETTNTYSRLIGTGGRGAKVCTDGTPGGSCGTTIYDFFVSKAGKLYFNDKGLIRTLDSGGNVQTLYGTAVSDGDGGLASDARIGLIDNLSFGKFDSVNNKFDKFYVTDGGVKEVREFTAGGTVNAVVSDATGWVASDPGTGDIYYAKNSTTKEIVRYNYSTGTTSRVAGGGGTHYKNAAANTTGTSIRMDVNGRNILGYLSGKIMAVFRDHGAEGYKDAFASVFTLNGDKTNTIYNTLIGKSGVTVSTTLSGQVGTDAVSVSELTLPSTTHLSVVDEINTDKILVLQKNSGNLFTLQLNGVAQRYVSLNRSTHAVARRVFSATEERFYYCSESWLYEDKVLTDGLGNKTVTQTRLNWKNNMVRCHNSSNGILYDAYRKVLIFAVRTTDAFHGVAEYQLD